jgi:hypothetical protein
MRRVRSAITKSFTRSASGEVKEVKRNSRLASFFKRSKREEFDGPTRSRSLDCIVVNASRVHAFDDDHNSFGEDEAETDAHQEFGIVSRQESVFEKETMANQGNQEGTPTRVRH